MIYYSITITIVFLASFSYCFFRWERLIAKTYFAVLDYETKIFALEKENRFLKKEVLKTELDKSAIERALSEARYVIRMRELS